MPDHINLRDSVFFPVHGDARHHADRADAADHHARLRGGARARHRRAAAHHARCRPARSWSRKFLVTYGFVVLMMAGSFVYPAMATVRGRASARSTCSRCSWASRCTRSALASLGLACSAFSSSQLVAAVASWAAGFVLWDFAWAGPFVSERSGRLLDLLSMHPRYGTLLRGRREPRALRLLRGRSASSAPRSRASPSTGGAWPADARLARRRRHRARLRHPRELRERGAAAGSRSRTSASAASALVLGTLRAGVRARGTRARPPSARPRRARASLRVALALARGGRARARGGAARRCSRTGPSSASSSRRRPRSTLLRELCAEGEVDALLFGDDFDPRRRSTRLLLQTLARASCLALRRALARRRSRRRGALRRRHLEHGDRAIRARASPSDRAGRAPDRGRAVRGLLPARGARGRPALDRARRGRRRRRVGRADRLLGPGVGARHRGLPAPPVRGRARRARSPTTSAAVLWIAPERPLPAEALAALDAYLARGGGLVAMLEPGVGERPRGAARALGHRARRRRGGGPGLGDDRGLRAGPVPARVRLRDQPPDRAGPRRHAA